MYKSIDTEKNKKTKKMVEAVFQRELEYIENGDIRNFATEMLRLAPGYFYSAPSSSSGKYHPPYENSKGGLVLHTKAVVFFVVTLCENKIYDFNARQRDLLITAALLHDSRKNGNNPHCEFTAFEHPRIEANFIMEHKDCGIIPPEEIKYIAQAVISHMGQWNTNGKKSKFEPLPLPETDAQKFLHLCDFLSSKKDIDLRSYLLIESPATLTVEDLKDLILGFGKYKNKTYGEVFKLDPAYLDWVYVQNMKNIDEGEKSFLSMEILTCLKRLLYEEGVSN